MATSWQRRPDGKDLAEPAQRPQSRAEIEAETKAKEAQRQLEKGEQAEVNPEVAAAMQRGLGNAAVQGMVKSGSETSTATTSAEAVQEEAKGEGEEEQEQEQEAGEVEHVLPSFSTGGGGGGGGTNKPGSSPWAVGRFFGGDDDAAPDEPPPEQARWRPMPFLPDPDDEEEIDAVEPGEADEHAELSAAEADAALGSATWRPGPLSRGLRHPTLLARRGVEPEMLAEGVSAVWGRARAMLRFLAVNTGMEPLSAAADAGVAPGGLSVVIAQELATLEAAFAALGPRWDIVTDVAVDARARARVEQAAAERVRAGVLSAPDLFATVTGEPISAAPSDWIEEVHRAALAAVEQAARVDVLPAVDLWDPGVPRAPDPELAAFDRMFGDLMGGRDSDAQESTVSAERVSALFTSMNALLGSLGAVQVEAAAAAVAAWPWVSGARLAAQLVPLDDALKSGARRLVAAGRAIEARIGTDAIGEVRAASAEASAVRGLAEFARRGCLIAIADLLELREEPPGDDAALRRVCAFGMARAASEPPPPLQADTPYAIALAAVADPRGHQALLEAAPRLKSLDHGAALNLLKARWMELS